MGLEKGKSQSRNVKKKGVSISKSPVIKKNEIRKDKTHYEISKDQLNLLELRRILNKNLIAFDKNHPHLKELYEIEKIKIKMREFLKQNEEIKKEKELQLKCTFKPELDKKSREIMKTHKEPQIERCKNWLEEKNIKLTNLEKTLQEEKIKKLEELAKPLPKYKTKIHVASKVKQFIESLDKNNIYFDQIIQKKNLTYSLKKLPLNATLKKKKFSNSLRELKNIDDASFNSFGKNNIKKKLIPIVSDIGQTGENFSKEQ